MIMGSIHQNQTEYKPQTTPIYVNGRVVGRVTNGTFHKSISGGKHLLKRPPAICFDRSTLRDAAKAGATCAAIFDRETGTTYTATLETIDAHSFSVRRGYGDQVGVPLDRWAVDGATPEATQRIAATNQERKDLQLTLFGEVA